MTSVISPSIFATPTFLTTGWYRLQESKCVHMIRENTESNDAQSLSSEDSCLQDLLERVALHDTKALSEIYDTHAGILMSVIFAILKDKGESEDILQDCFLTVWKKAGMYQAHLGKPKSWLVTIAKNKAYDRYRKQQRQNDGKNSYQDSLRDDAFSSVVDSTADNERLAAGINDLNAEQKEAIEMVFFQGLTQQEVAEKLETPLGTVKARIRRGLLKLKDFLNNDSRNQLQ